MLDDRVDPGGTASAAGLHAAYRAVLAEVVEAVGPERVARETGVSADGLARLGSADGPELTLSEAAAVLGCSPDRPAAATVERELRDDLVVGMAGAARDAAAVAGAAGPDLDADAVRAVVDGSRDLSLREYAQVRHHLAREATA